MNRIFAIAAFILLIISNVSAKEFFVSVKGTDKNCGSKEEPFATINRAQFAIRDYKKKASKPDSLIVWIREGEYYIHSTLRLEEEDSGYPGFPVIYKAYSNEKVRVLGGKLLPVSSMRSIRKNELPSHLSDSDIQKDIRVINLKKLGIIDFGIHQQYGFGLPVVNASMELFVNHQRMNLSRYPNEGYIKIGKVIDSGSVPRRNDYSNIRGGTFQYTDDRHENWVGEENVWIKGTLNRGYADDRIKIKHIDKQKKLVTLATPHMYGIAGGKDFQQYYAENIFSELDSPGEYFMDEQSGNLYFIPPTGEKISELAVSILEDPMISFMNASFIEFHNIIIEITRGLGIYIEGGNSNRIQGCIIRNIGTVAVMMGQGAKQTFPNITHDEYEGIPVSEEVGSLSMHIYNHSGWDRKAGYNHGIQSCEIYNTGTGGIVLSGGSKKQLINGGCYVDNSRIYDFQTRVATQGTAISVDGCGNRVSHNEIFNSDQQAIWVRGNNHIFEYNELHHIALNTNDASAFYMGRDPSDQGQIIRYNFFHHVGRPDRELTMGIYFDDSACGAVVEGNVFYKVASYGTIYSNAGSDLTIRNNIFIEGYGPALQLKSRWWDRLLNRQDQWFEEGSLFHKRLLSEVDIKNPPYSLQYPELTSWLDLADDGYTHQGMYPQRNSFVNNVIVKYEETSRLVGINANVAFDNNYATSGDPGFINASEMDFELINDSKVFKKIPGFKPIPFKQIGIKETRDRWFIKNLMNDPESMNMKH